MKNKIMKAAVFFIAILFFIGINIYIISDCFCSYQKFVQKNESILFQKYMHRPPLYSRALDVDFDGEDEVVYTFFFSYPNKNAIAVFEPFKKDFNFHHYGDILIPVSYAFFDIYYDRSEENYVFRFLDSKEGKLVIKDVDNCQNLRKKLKVEGLDIELPEEGIAFLKPTLLDLELDGKEELVALFKPGNERSLSTILCIEPGTGRVLWKYQTAPVIVDAIFKDLDKDGKKNIILSTFAANKGVELDKTSDASSYVIVLDNSGKKSWIEKIGGHSTFTRTSIEDLDGDGFYEIVTATECHPAVEREGGKIVILDGLTGTQKAEYQEQTTTFSKPLVLKSKAGTFIYIGDSEGNLRMFDRELNLLKKVKIKEDIPVYALKASDQPGKWNNVFVYCRDQLIAYDMELKRKIFGFNFEPPARLNEFITPKILLPMNTKEGNHAFVNSDALYLLSEKKITFSKVLKNMVVSGLLFSSMVFILFNLFSFFLFYRWRKAGQILRQSQEKAADTSESLDLFQGIIHQLKNPIATIMWTAEKIKRSVSQDKKKLKREDYSQLADFLVDDVKNLKQQTNNILKLIQIQEPNFQEKNLKILLQKLVEQYRAVVDEKIKIQLDMGGDIILSIDENLFKEAFANMVDNAVDAMPDGGKLTISVVPVTSPVKGDIKEVLIEIEDTGSGMDEEEISRVFEPFFTKKGKGTGIGLTITRRIVEVHGGTINIHSRKDFGTRVAINMPMRP